MTSSALSPVTLAGAIVRLEPLARSHAAALARIGLAPELWELQPKRIENEADMEAYVAQALDEQERGASLPFAVVRQDSGAVIGSTRYMDLALPHRRLEIGATWYAPAQQRTGANVEAKLLLLRHAFDTLGMRKVVFKTEALNVRSRTAILALGAVQEGLFRQHLLAADGRVRDMVYFGILADDWLDVRERLEARLARHDGGSP